MVVHDPIGGPIGVGVAEWLAAAGRDVALVTPDQIAGTLLSLSGDLADANTRLQRAGVRRELRALVRRLEDGRVHLEDVWTGATRDIPAAVLVDCGHRLPEEALYLERPGHAAGRRLRGPAHGARGRAGGAATGPRDLRGCSRPPASPIDDRSHPVTDTDATARQGPTTGPRAGWPARWP